MIQLNRTQIETVFDDLYPAHRAFPKNFPQLWELCCSAVTDPETLAGIQFANDYLATPPAKSFLACSKPQLHAIYGPDIEIEDAAKRAIGGFFAAIFKGLLGYTKQRSVSVTIPEVNLRTATLYSGAPETSGHAAAGGEVPAAASETVSED